MLEISKLTGEKVIKIIKNRLSDSDSLVISPENTFNDLGIDSIDFIEIIIETEDAFNIEFTDEALYIGKFEYIADFVDYVNEMILLKKVENE